RGRGALSLPRLPQPRRDGDRSAGGQARGRAAPRGRLVEDRPAHGRARPERFAREEPDLLHLIAMASSRSGSASRSTSVTRATWPLRARAASSPLMLTPRMTADGWHCDTPAPRVLTRDPAVPVVARGGSLVEIRHLHAGQVILRDLVAFRGDVEAEDARVVQAEDLLLLAARQGRVVVLLDERGRDLEASERVDLPLGRPVPD